VRRCALTCGARGVWRLRRAQAMIETLLSVIFVTFVLLVSVQLMRWLAMRILLEHGAARAARAHAIGYNEFMCQKAARVAIIPVSGRRLWPSGRTDSEADKLISTYLNAPTVGHARGILDYEKWGSSSLSVTTVDFCVNPKVRAEMTMSDAYLPLRGLSEVEAHYPFYMDNSGW